MKPSVTSEEHIVQLHRLGRQLRLTQVVLVGVAVAAVAGLLAEPNQPADRTPDDIRVKSIDFGSVKITPDGNGIAIEYLGKKLATLGMAPNAVK